MCHSAQSSLELCVHLWRLEDQLAFCTAAAIPRDVSSLVLPGPLSRGKEVDFDTLHEIGLFDHV